MKEAIEFLSKELYSLYSSNKHLEIRYEFDSIIDTHIIEIKPIHCFEKDRQFADKQIEIEESFKNLFPNEDVLFITDNILIKVLNPILELGVSNNILVGEVFFPTVRTKRFGSSELLCVTKELAEPPLEYSYTAYPQEDPNFIGSSSFNTISI